MTVYALGMYDMDEVASTYLTRNPDKTYSCTICGKASRDIHAAKSHLDSIHFPSEGHNCQICGKFCKSKHALTCHMSIYHRNK